MNTPSIAIRDSSRPRSIKSRTSPTYSPTKTPLFRPRTATRPIRSCGWICGRSRSSCRSRRWTPSATTRSCCATVIPTTMAISAAGPRGGGAGDYMVVGRDGRGAPPAGIKKVFRSSTQLSVAGYRTQLFNPDDLDGVKKVQAGYKVQTLSAYLKQPATTAAAAIDFPKIDKQLVKTNFFEYLDFALQFAPAQENEKEIRAQLARIGVGPGKTMNFKDLSIEDKLEIGLGMKEGDRKVDEAVANAGKAVNGWRVSGLPGDSAHYNRDWLMRATAAKAGIYGNDPAEATYPITRTDGDGQTLDGSKR